MPTILEIFFPLANNSSISNTTTSGTDRVALNIPTEKSNAGQYRVRVVNDSDKTQYVNFGVDNTVTSSASANSPVMAGEDVIFGLQQSMTYVAAVVDSGVASGKINFQIGRGS